LPPLGTAGCGALALTFARRRSPQADELAAAVGFRHNEGMDDALRPGRAPAAAAAASGSAADARLAGARLLARLLDDAIPIPGTSYRIGIDPLLGLVPGVGDVLGALLSTWLLVIAARLGAPPAVLARMGLNVAIDALAGAIPLAGDVFDAGWKANARNLRLVEGWLERPGPTRRSSGALVAGIALGTLAAVAAILFAAWRLVAWASRAA
jgi:hypothetical protein